MRHSQHCFFAPALQNGLTAALIVSMFYAPLLALQPKPVAAAAPKSSLHPRNLTPPPTVSRRRGVLA